MHGEICYRVAQWEATRTTLKTAKAVTSQPQISMLNSRQQHPPPIVNSLSLRSQKRAFHVTPSNVSERGKGRKDKPVGCKGTTMYNMEGHSLANLMLKLAE